MLFISACLTGGAARAADEVEYIDDSGQRLTVRGNIRDETPREVLLQTTKDTVHIPVYQIEQVRYDKQPAALISAKSKERQGRWDEAIEEYREIGKSLTPEQERLRAAIAFQIFRATAQAGLADPAKSDQAIAWFEKHGSQLAETRHFYPVRELLGRVYLQRGEYAKAADAFAPLAKLDWPGYRERAGVYQSLALLRQGKLSEAASELEAVLRSKGTGPAVVAQKQLAEVLKGEVLVHAGKPAEAEALLRKSLDAIPRTFTEAKAIGHNALGDALLAANQPKDAMLDGYLWVVVIYNQHPDQLARALFRLHGLFGQIGQPDRAKEMAERLRAEFPSSEWTKKLPMKSG